MVKKKEGFIGEVCASMFLMIFIIVIVIIVVTLVFVLIFFINWLINNGLSGILELILTFFKAIWCGVGGC